ncbi:MAG: protein-disulfide reductase DsbD domain-containing protein [Myxococcota bacterium]|nr:protein-disulfide reductase DsbD domain-containing protein [Myxococcota bacterium]
MSAVDPASLVALQLLLVPGGVPGHDGPAAVIQAELAPKWHIYWVNSGDTGMPTEVDWTLPEGVQSGAEVWSVPHAIERPGGLTDFGYEGHATIALPLSGDTDKAGQITASVSYLVCRADQCIPGSAELSVQESPRSPRLHELPEPLECDREAGEVRIPVQSTSAHLFPDLSLAEAWKEPEPAGEALRVALDPAAQGVLLVRDGKRLGSCTLQD